MPNQPIPVSDAEQMTTLYIGYMQSLGVSMATQTHSVSFVADDLFNWMREMMPYTDEFRICMGVYPPGHVHAGRTSAIIWPYWKGEPAVYPEGEAGVGGGGPINPFNDGGLNP